MIIQGEFYISKGHITCFEWELKYAVQMNKKLNHPEVQSEKLSVMVNRL